MDLTHLAFADDLILFAKGDVPSVELIVGCLQQFGACSGLRLNVAKSSVFMAGIGRADMAVIQASTGFSLGSFELFSNAELIISCNLFVTLIR